MVVTCAVVVDGNWLVSWSTSPSERAREHAVLGMALEELHPNASK